MTSSSIREIDFQEFDITDNHNKIIDHFKETGILIIKNVFTSEECLSYCNKIIESVRSLCPKLDPNDLDTWKPKHLPPGPRTGLFQHLVSTFPAVLEIRTDPRIRKIFETVYSGLRGQKLTEFFTSMDGINVRPHMPPFQHKNDWAHLDQTIPNKPFLCVQGQVVLSNTSACFRASPKSYLVHDQILDYCEEMEILKSGDTSNWLKFPRNEYRAIRELVESVGGEWQIPVRAPKGSVILWTSSTVHSAMTQSEKPNEYQWVDEDPWEDWRFVVYTCYRPKTDIIRGRKQHAARLQKCVEESRVTNHWGSRMFPKKQFRDATIREETLQDLVDNPEKVSSVVGKPSEEVAMRLKPLISE